MLLVAAWDSRWHPRVFRDVLKVAVKKENSVELM